MDVDPDPQASPDAVAVLDDDHDEEYEDIDPSGSRKRHRSGQDANDTDSEEEEEGDARSPPNLHPDDPPNFCKLASGVKLLLAWPITDPQIDEAECLLRSYCPELVTVCKPVPSLSSVLILKPIPALWGRCHQTQSPLRYAHSRGCPKLRPSARVLDFPVRTHEQGPQKFQLQ